MDESQKKALIESINTCQLYSIIGYFLMGELSLYDVPNISSDRRKIIKDYLTTHQSPQEQKEWAEIESKINTPSTDLLDKLTAYINKWEGIKPKDNHVDTAKEKQLEIGAKIREEVEGGEWDNVNKYSLDDLLDFLSKHPDTGHISEIDDNVWSLINHKSVQDIQRYITALPKGKHIDETQAILTSILDWDSVKNTDDIFKINDYIKANPDSPFIDQAKILLIGLKQRELDFIRSNPNRYEANRLLSLTNEGIFADRELIREGVITDTILETLRNNDINSDLPDIRQAINNSKAECKEGYTDVFFFGVPSTGKTCVLMGLSRSDSLHINLASGGGDYAAALQQYTDVGVTVPRTPGTFVTTLEATISTNINPDIVHRINLVEMSGEEFLFEIAKNPNGNLTYIIIGYNTLSKLYDLQIVKNLG